MTAAQLVGVLFSARVLQQLSQETVAGRMGITQAALSQLELRQRVGSIETFERWSAALGYELSLTPSGEPPERREEEGA